MRLALALAALAVAAGPAAAAGNVSVVIQVLLSSQAAKEMSFTGQQLGVAAVFYGVPNKASAHKADSMGQIDLGMENIRIFGEGGIGVITGKALKRANLGFIEGKPQVNVNVFSTRNGSASNILSCDILDGNIPSDGETTRLHCKLIGEK